jgi:hypothetical protein
MAICSANVTNNQEFKAVTKYPFLTMSVRPFNYQRVHFDQIKILEVENIQLGITINLFPL